MDKAIMIILNVIFLINNKINPLWKWGIMGRMLSGGWYVVTIRPIGSFLGYTIYQYTLGTERKLELYEEFIAACLQLQGGGYITVSSLFETYLTIREQEAILAHEIGHLKNGHNAITDEFEEIADNYAISLGLRASLKTALNKLMILLTNKLAEQTEDYDLAVQIMIPLMQPRIDRL